jgi:membrane-associated phospholipid phosphatase
MDARMYRQVNRLAVRSAWAHGFMNAFAVYGVGILAVLVVAGWWLARDRPDSPRAVAAAVWTGAGALVAVGINQPIASAFHRARPFQALPGVEVLVSRSHDFTFPSDHAVAAGAAAAGLWLFSRRLAIAGTVVAVFLAFCRVYVGAHYPGDVTAGLALGAAVVAGGWLAMSRLLIGLVEAIRASPLWWLTSAHRLPESA